MSKRIISLIIGILIGIGIMYFGHSRSVTDVNEVLAGKYKLVKQREWDSVSMLISRLEDQRKVDSLSLSVRLESNKKQVVNLTHEIQKISFKEYSDPELDSLIHWLYPSPRPDFEW
jgi:archaellum component FlaF (FlaF/FlaG flagellin family)